LLASAELSTQQTCVIVGEDPAAFTIRAGAGMIKLPDGTILHRQETAAVPRELVQPLP